eukprot:sb/3470132/
MKRRAVFSKIPDVPFDDYPSLPTIDIQCPFYFGRKLLGTILSFCILLLSLLYTTFALFYYSSPPEPIQGGYMNSLKELLLLTLSTLLFITRVAPVCDISRVVAMVTINRQIISMVCAAVNAIAHFGVLLRWYVQEGEVYIKSLENYRLLWQVKLIMITLLLAFILSFIVFCLMLLTQMGPKFRDLNPDLTAQMKRAAATQVVPIEGAQPVV